MKTKLQIKHRWLGSVLFEFETQDNTILKTLKQAISQGADLRSANLEGADLRSANLRSANLEGANLEGANLEGANLEGANLEGANLEGANLEGANLEGANLEGADLRSADLRSADLRSANLEGANLRSANLKPIKEDMFIVLLHGIREIDFLRQNILDGKIDGSTYTGPCACLSGTIMNGVVEHNGPDQPKLEKLVMDCRDSLRPIERFFCGISEGDTPDTSQFSALALEWVDEFRSLIGMGVVPKKKKA